MKEYILIEFIFLIDEILVWDEKLKNLGDDFINLGNEFQFSDDAGGSRKTYVRVTGKINSLYASIIKLQDPYLAEHMKISYIPDEIKDRYRR